MHTNNWIKPASFSWVLLGFVIMMAGCSHETSEKKDATQVAAKVNDEEITVHQVNQILRTQNPAMLQGQDKQEIQNKALDALISQEVLVQEAKKQKLDRDPDVLTAMEAAKRKVLMDAYLQRVLQNQAQVSDGDIKTFYNEHDQMFKNRKIFTYVQLHISADQAKQDELISKVKELNDLKAFEAYLKDENLEYQRSSETKGSESVNKALLTPLNSIAAGDTGYFKVKDGLIVIYLMDAQEQPMTLDESKSMIQQYLAVQNRKEVIEKIVNGLRDDAQVEYLGDFTAVEKKQ